MLNLLRANFFRLFRERVFYVLLFVTCGFAAMIALLSSWTGLVGVGTGGGTVRGGGAEILLFGAFNISNGAVLTSIIGAAVLTGGEFRNGTIRNKLTAGCSRFNVFAANAVVCSALFLMFSAAFMLVTLVIAGPLMGFTSGVTAGAVVGRIALGIPIVITAACVANFLSMVSRSMLGSVLWNILIALILPLVLSGIYASVSMKQGVGADIIRVIFRSLYAGQSMVLTTGLTGEYFDLIPSLSTLVAYVLVSSAAMISAAVAGGGILFSRLDLK